MKKYSIMEILKESIDYIHNSLLEKRIENTNIAIGILETIDKIEGLPICQEIRGMLNQNKNSEAIKALINLTEHFQTIKEKIAKEHFKNYKIMELDSYLLCHEYPHNYTFENMYFLWSEQTAYNDLYYYYDQLTPNIIYQDSICIGD